MTHSSLGVVASSRVRAAGGPLVFSESFNKADGALGPDLTWDLVQNTLTVVSNQAKNPNSNVAIARAAHDLSSPDMYGEVVVYHNGASSATTHTQRIYLRLQDAGNYYAVAIRAEGSQIFKLVSGSFVAITNNLSTPNWSDGDTARFEVEGSDLRLYRNGSLIESETDSTITAGVRGGFGIHNSTVTVDSFEIGDIA